MVKDMSAQPSSPKDKKLPSLLRKGSSSRIPLKEKIVQLYEAFFRGEDPSTGNPNFWDEFFLLKANTTFMENEFEKLNAEQLVGLKENINDLFYKCTQVLQQEHPIRVVNALQTLCALIQGVFRKSSSDHGFDILDILMGFDAAEGQMQILMESVNTILMGDSPLSLKTLALRLPLVLVTATDNVSQNTVLEYVMINSIFETIIQILGSPTARQDHGHDAVLLLTILVQYRKHESANPYIVKLSILDDELALTGFAQVVSYTMTEFNRQYQLKNTEQATGFFASLTSMTEQARTVGKGRQSLVKSLTVKDCSGEIKCSLWGSAANSGDIELGQQIVLSDIKTYYCNLTHDVIMNVNNADQIQVGSMFVAEEKKIEPVKANDSILLALYEAVHLNRNFITTLTHSHTPSTPTTPPASPTTPKANPLTSPAVQGPKLDSALTEPANQPTNLLVTFLEYSSIIMQDIKDGSRFNNAKLCIIILTCIAEDQYANSLMHDVNMNFRVPLHRMPMRHRKITVDKKPPSRPLACALLDLMGEFLMSHMMKNFPMELYLKCLGVIQRVLCYQKKCRVRLQYTWKDLWTALINLLKFVLSNETHLVKKHDIFHLANKVVNIFNLFITYGDTFLPNPSSYDELYYELIRMHQVFDNLYSMALRYTTNEGQWKESAVRLTNALVNIRAIINHFTPKVDSWAATNHLSSLTEEQVLEVVRGNYDSLTLKLQDNLDQFLRYEEKPKETAFFTQLVRSIVADVRKNVNTTNLEQQLLLQEFSVIS